MNTTGEYTAEELKCGIRFQPTTTDQKIYECGILLLRSQIWGKDKWEVYFPVTTKNLRYSASQFGEKLSGKYISQ
jgi:hypothetical protein